MTLDLDRDDRATPRPAPRRRLALISGSVTLALTLFATLAPAHSQDPEVPPPTQETKTKQPRPAPKVPPKAKAKVAEPKEAEPAVETPMPQTPEVAPDTPKQAADLPLPPNFSRVPRTPTELWEVVDYMVRAGQSPQAVPYLQRFIASEPDDPAMLALRDEFGELSFLRLEDADATRPFAKTVVDRLNGAIVRHANDPARIARHVSALAKSQYERNYAIRELRTAGSNAVPPILAAFRSATGVDQKLIADALGRLDRNAVPALIATLQSPDEADLAVACDSLARIGDPRAVPALTWVAARPIGPGKSVAAGAIARMSGRPFEAQPKSPSQVLTDEARTYQLGKFPPADPTTIWLWDTDAKLPAPRTMPRAEALATLGGVFARDALVLDKSNETAQTIAIALDLAKARKPTPTALAAGPVALGRVVRQAIADRRPDVAITAIASLAKVTDRNTLGGEPGKPTPLVEALSAPDRRVQFAAAEAIVGLEPKAAFPGASKLVPVLARFASNPSQHGAIIIDGNPNRGAQVAGFLQPLGYDTQFARTGEEGFRQAASAANIELVIVNPIYLGGAWKLYDTLANLRADARTAGLPIFLVGPIDLEDRMANVVQGFSGIYYIVTPTESALLKTQIDRGLARHASPLLTDAERTDLAVRASTLLSRIASSKESPFASDIASAEPDLILALNHAPTAPSAATALGDIPTGVAQRSLADILLDPAQPLASRIKMAEGLAHSLRRFGPLLLTEQEQRLVAALDSETNPDLRTALATVVGALKPKSAAVGRWLSAEPPTTTK